MFVNYYAILNITQNATKDEIKAAFKKQAIKWHPDKNPNTDTRNKRSILNSKR